MRKNNHEKMLDVVFILDKSGSMGGSEEQTISSFNEYLEQEKNNKFKTRITALLFSNSYEYLYKREDIKKVSKLTENEYYVGGCTALYDALGEGIHYIDHQNTDKVLFIIITDGYENASKEFNKNKIRKMIEDHSSWEFIYIGADIDSYAAGGEMGIKRTNIANYSKSKKGTKVMFEAVHAAGCSMMCDEEMGESWKTKLDNYIDENI